MSGKLKFVIAIAVFALLWFAIRLPYVIERAAEKYFGGPNQVDPLTLHLDGEFVESNLGTAVEPDGSVTVRLIAQQFNFVPNCMLVPAGIPVRFRITSADVVHRFTISGTEDQVVAVPGHVTESRVQFSTAGDHYTPCHEFCGAGHYDMRSHLRVVPGSEFPKAGPQERLTCAPR